MFGYNRGMRLTNGTKTLENLSLLNVIVGKNGCGKSTLLKLLEANPGIEGAQTKYVTPERGGSLIYNPNVEQSIVSDINWMKGQRRRNQDAQFRQQSVAQYRRLELGVLRASEGREIADFDPYVEKINGLLDNIEMRRDESTFKLFDKTTGSEIRAENISSGEAELISLAIEVLVFGNEAEPGRENILFLDEPDVHLHPDLQQRFCRFLIDVVKTQGFTVLVATHSTAFLSGVAVHPEASVAFMKAGDDTLSFESISDAYRTVLPVFGAHPLSNVFNDHPVLLLEGEDDVRLWQQVLRSSEGRVRIYPVACGDKRSISQYESLVAKIVNALYDDGIAYSIRDGDGVDQPLQHTPPIQRYRLICRAAENLLLTTETLKTARTSWAAVKRRILEWVEENDKHPRYLDVVAFIDDGMDRKSFNLKPIRQLLAAQFIGSTKPWEVLVGQTIADLRVKSATSSKNGLRSYLGDELCLALLS